MSESDSAQVASSSVPSRPIRPRVWRACEVCRKRKIKCDGQDPCAFCTANNKDCTFTLIQDNASFARQQQNDIQQRLEKLEQTLGKLLPLAEGFQGWLDKQPGSSNSNFSSAMPSFGVPEQDFPGQGDQSHSRAPKGFNSSPYAATTSGDVSGEKSFDMEGDAGYSSLARSPAEEVIMDPARTTETVGVQQVGHTSIHAEEDAEAEVEGQVSWADRLGGQYAKDSMGNLRYLGGASNYVLAEAFTTLKTAKAMHGGPDPERQGSGSLDHLYFRPNAAYRRLSGLPRPQDAIYPPIELSNALVHMYFRKIHHTFPIIDEISFYRKYMETMSLLQAGTPSTDANFLCVLFAVYASAASLTKHGMADNQEFAFSSPREYVGLEFYERALYLYWENSRMLTLDHITCSAVLSSCLAGWNTLSQAWILAGQAVRGSQDLGLHRSPRKSRLSAPEQEERRRVWWCVYGLDKVLSVSLGRPSATNEDDCDVELPSDHHPEAASGMLSLSPDDSQAGFVCLLRIYSIMSLIERRGHSIAFLRKYNNDPHEPKVREVIKELDDMLGDWSETLPPSVRFAANDTSRPHTLALCLLAHMTMYAAILNLHRPLMPDATYFTPFNFGSLTKCVNAAKGCIRIGELVKQMLPKSHHCQFCVQYITISGVLLLRCVIFVKSPALVAQLLADARNCRRLLSELEDTWPASKACGKVIEDLLRACEENARRDVRSSELVQPLPELPAMPGPGDTYGNDQHQRKRRREDELADGEDRSTSRAKTGSQQVVQAQMELPAFAESYPPLAESHSRMATVTDPYLHQSPLRVGHASTDRIHPLATAAPAPRMDLPYTPMANGITFDLAPDIEALFASMRDPPGPELDEQLFWDTLAGDANAHGFDS